MFAAMRPARAAALPPQFDVILCNPPYVRTDDMRQLPAEYQHEPKLALDGGADGMKFVRVLLREAYVCVWPARVASVCWWWCYQRQYWWAC